MILALAYLVAELWHGPSRRTWAATRIAAALAVMGPAVLWLLSRPLCGLVGVDSVNPGSAACPAVIPDAVLTVRTLGLLTVVALGAFVLGRGILALGREAGTTDEMDRASGRGGIGSGTMGRLGRSALVLAIALVGVALLPDTEILTLTSLPVEPIALIVGLALAYLAAQVLAARDPRRFVYGLLLAVAGWFVVWYPNIAALPLPSTLVNAYQGFLPSYLYAFQFPVSTTERNVATPLLSPTPIILGVALVVTCLVVAYSAWLWRIALAESEAAGTDDGAAAAGPPSDGLARRGGGA